MPKTRKVRTKRKPAVQKDRQNKKTWWVQIRLFPIWLRVVLVLVLLGLAAAGGAMVGYGIIGDGEPRDALRWETWQHIFDIMEGTELEGSEVPAETDVPTEDGAVEEDAVE
ncbi:DNA-directed RNA polymerase subunit beta [Planococcus lenghuensis]|uniref:DNA-directed RNA polymerase subunit beta n=1 Tax=Planococcus lenghuensis TaxID=2213202 RepID=UPI000984688A